jgi:alkaline phosphatase D
LLGLVADARCSAGSAITAGPWSGAITPTSAVVKVAHTAEADAIRLRVGTDPDLSRARTLSATPAQSSGTVAGFALTDLQPATRYYYVVQVADAVVAETHGELLTFPIGPASFRFAFASCARTGSSNAVFTSIREQSPAFFMNTGDFHYENIAVDDPTVFEAVYRRVLASPTQSDLYRHIPFVYMWDDHDYVGNNSHGGSPGRAAARQVYQEWVPHYPLPAGGGDVAIYQSFEVGRVKFIVTDLRSERSPSRQPEDGAKTMLGAEQKEWFKRELLAARERYPLIFWVSSVPWISEAPTVDDVGRKPAKPPPDFWGSYATERRELADFFKANQLTNLCLLSGDAHMLAADDGSHSDYATDGGAPLRVLQAASLDQKASLKGGPYSQGYYLPMEGEGCYGLVTVTDVGRELRVNYRGLNQFGEEKIAMDFTVPADSRNVAPK